MANFERFTHEEIPYGTLAKFGLTQEMIDDLPTNVMNRFLSARATPVLPLVMENIEGEKVQSFARVSLVRLNNGAVDVCFAPKWEDEDLNEFSPEQQELLREGKAIKANMPGKGDCYVQLDESINQVMMVPVNIIDQNISVLTRSFNMTEDEQETLQKGDVIEINYRDIMISAGIDLNELSGIRIVDGDVIDWQRDAKADKLPKYNFGLFGCWMSDDNNMLSYVPEEEYDEEMVLEQKRVGLQNAAEENQKQLKMG